MAENLPCLSKYINLLIIKEKKANTKQGDRNQDKSSATRVSGIQTDTWAGGPLYHMTAWAPKWEKGVILW